MYVMFSTWMVNLCSHSVLRSTLINCLLCTDASTLCISALISSFLLSNLFVQTNEHITTTSLYTLSNTILYIFVIYCIFHCTLFVLYFNGYGNVIVAILTVMVVPDQLFTLNMAQGLNQTVHMTFCICLPVGK